MTDNIYSYSARQTVIGVTSFVAEMNGTRCDIKNFPSVFARVTGAMDWIRGNTQGAQNSRCQDITAADTEQEEPYYENPY